jgi:flavin reductase (DIM6/NTAB) family NADH-FMN oxidoreductase RutF
MANKSQLAAPAEEPPVNQPQSEPELDRKLRQGVLRMIPYGVHVITTRDEPEVSASIVDWVTQTSFEPPLVAVCLRKDSFPLTLVRRAGRFALHPLGESQKDFAKNFFRFKSASAGEINGQAYKLGPAGMPLLEEAPASMELVVIDELDHGDHALVLGRVIGVYLKYEAEPLLLRQTGWNYGG